MLKNRKLRGRSGGWNVLILQQVGVTKKWKEVRLLQLNKGRVFNEPIKGKGSYVTLEDNPLCPTKSAHKLDGFNMLSATITRGNVKCLGFTSVINISISIQKGCNVWYTLDEWWNSVCEMGEVKEGSTSGIQLIDLNGRRLKKMGETRTPSTRTGTW